MKNPKIEIKQLLMDNLYRVRKKQFSADGIKLTRSLLMYRSLFSLNDMHMYQSQVKIN